MIVHNPIVPFAYASDGKERSDKVSMVHACSSLLIILYHVSEGRHTV